MIATIKSIHIENFKGIKDKTFDFHGLPSVVTGANGTGKTTIATAYMWLFTDKDLGLNSNPDVKPIGVEECTPTVTLIMDIDGKQVEFKKIQKNKKSKPDDNGNYKISTTNSYEINSVPKNERDFKAYLTEIGLPIDADFLLMSHTEVFSAMKQADQRKILFSMVDGITDLDVAEKVSDIDELYDLMQTYKIEEIEAMQKASKKKAEDELKNIPGQIEGLEMAKTEDVDTSDVELLVNQLTEQIAVESSKEAEIHEKENTLMELRKKGLGLEFDRNTELTSMNEQAMAGRKEIESKLNDVHNNILDIQRDIKVCNNNIEQTNNLLEYGKKRFEELKAKYEDAKALVFDDSSTICPTCGRPYEQERVDEIKAKFEADKKAKMDEINHKAKDIQTTQKEHENTLASHKAALADLKNKLDQAESLNASLEQELNNFKPTDVAKTPKLAEIEAKIEENNKAKAELENMALDSLLNEVRGTIAVLQGQLQDAKVKLNVNNQNIEIDAKIEKLSDKRMSLEQAKANCEKILYQISVFSKARNEMLTGEINKYFKKVKYQLFKIQKNGEYAESCQVMSLDDKPLGVSTNTALEVEMKMDICQGFQRYYNKMLPLFVDRSESFSSDSYNNLECETQHIYLKVTDGDLEVK